MKRLVIIGNGFDLAHGLKTSLHNFRDFMEIHDSSFVAGIKKCAGFDIDWNELESVLDCLEPEDFKEKNYAYLIDPASDEWRDSANHDYQYQIDVDSEFIQSLSKNLKKWIRTIDVNVTPVFPKELFEGDCEFLTFNYTRTLEVVYNISESNIWHVHGDALDDYNKLIVGHNDKEISKPDYYGYPDEDIDWRIQEGDETIYERMKLLYKGSAEIIDSNQWFFEELSDVSEIYVIGHSMSYIDEIYFQHILKLVPAECVWNITYHGDSTETEMEDYNKKLNSISSIGIKNYNLIKSDDLLKKEVKLRRK